MAVASFLTFLCVMLSGSCIFASNSYYNNGGYGSRYTNQQYHQSPSMSSQRSNETRDEYLARLEREKLDLEDRKRIQEDQRKTEQKGVLELKGKTMALLVMQLLQAHKQNTIQGKTHQNFMLGMVKFVQDFVEELDPYHPFHKDIKNFKTELSHKLENRPLNFLEKFKTHMLSQEFLEKYESGERVNAPTEAQFPEIAAHEKYWPYFCMYIIQELEGAQNKCNAARAKCTEDLTRRASAFARNVESKKEDAPHRGVLSRKITDAMDEAFAQEQRLTKQGQEHMYSQTLMLLEGYLSHGAREIYTNELRTLLHGNKEGLDIYKKLKDAENSTEEEENTLPVRKTYTTPWPKVKTEAEKQKEAKEKKEKEAKAQKKAEAKKKEKNNQPEKKALSGLQEKGMGLVDGLFGKILKGIG